MREESRIKERQKPEAELALEGRRRLGLLTFRPPSPEPGGLYLAEPVAAVYLRPPRPHPPSQSLFSPSQSARAVLC